MRPEPGLSSSQDPPCVSVNALGGEVHVWYASLSVAHRHICDLEQTLDVNEKMRVHRFRFQRDRNRFIVARSFLRMILGSYLGCKPSELGFDYSPYGKPSLAFGFDDGSTEFNLSHSHTLALYAITRNRRVGVDIELMCPIQEPMEIAMSFFSPNEITQLLSVSQEARTHAFFNCWTRKEAYIKAKGQGLSIPLSQFTVSLITGEEPCLLRTEWDAEEASRWAMRDLRFAAGYSAALVVEGHEWELKCSWWNPGAGLDQSLLGDLLF